LRKQNKLKRVYYHYEELEEFHAGMWRIIRGDARKKCILDAAALMKDADRFSHAMRRALKEWKKSCEHSLSAESTNRIAYLGHAGCCIEVGSPEEATRAAWHTLSNDEQDRANEAAAIVLNEWEREKIVSILELKSDQFDLFGGTNAQKTDWD